jgi:predicted membrane protein
MDKSKKTEAILVIVTGLILLHLILKIKVLLTIALLVAVLSLMSDFVRDQIFRLWMKLAEILGYINGRILLSLIFFLILTPVAFLFKLTGKDPMQRKRRKESNTMYVERNHSYTREDLEFIW